MLFFTAYLLHQFLFTDSSHIYEIIMVWAMHFPTQLIAGLHNSKKSANAKCHFIKVTDGFIHHNRKMRSGRFCSVTSCLMWANDPTGATKGIFF